VSATMHDVGRRSGVSVATVSNVLHNTAPVADETRRRVLVAIDELGYRTNEVARSLKRRATQTLGVVMPDVLNPFHAAIARQIERRAHHDGFAVVISATEYDRDTEADQVRALVRRRVDGVIFPAVTEGSAIPGELLDRGIPVVVVSFAAHDPRLGVVDIDEAEAMLAVVGHLAALGHRRIAFAPATMREEAIDRRPEALRSALAAHGLEEAGMLDSHAGRGSLRIGRLFGGFGVFGFGVVGGSGAIGRGGGPVRRRTSGSCCERSRRGTGRRPGSRVEHLYRRGRGPGRGSIGAGRR